MIHLAPSLLNLIKLVNVAQKYHKENPKLQITIWMLNIKKLANYMKDELLENMSAEGTTASKSRF